ncbi:hypothetical protein LZ31DRAFT_50402 [Colletotrichum somersetense]|nr:hypothetical protein LZ31DRAFT_50402 [Colletotrichum somersetense]
MLSSHFTTSLRLQLSIFAVQQHSFTASGAVAACLPLKYVDSTTSCPYLRVNTHHDLVYCDADIQHLVSICDDSNHFSLAPNAYLKPTTLRATCGPL